MIIYRTPTLLDVEAVVDIQDKQRVNLPVYYPKIPINTVTGIINASIYYPKDVFVLIVDKINNNIYNNKNKNKNIISSSLTSSSSLGWRAGMREEQSDGGSVNNTLLPACQEEIVLPLPIRSQVGFISCLTHSYYGMLVSELDAIYVDSTRVNSFEMINIFRGMIRRANNWSKNIGAYRIVYTNNSGDSRMLDRLLEKEGANRIGSSVEFRHG